MYEYLPVSVCICECLCIACFSLGQQMENLRAIRIIMWVKHAKMFAPCRTNEPQNAPTELALSIGIGLCTELRLSAAVIRLFNAFHLIDKISL